MVTASASEVPEELLNQLATGGKMIIAVGKDYIQELRLIEKDAHGSISSTHLNDVAFVRLKGKYRSEEHTSELQSRGHLVCRLLLEKKKNINTTSLYTFLLYHSGHH